MSDTENGKLLGSLRDWATRPMVTTRFDMAITITVNLLLGYIAGHAF